MVVVPAAASYAAAILYMRWSPMRTFLSLSVVLPVVGLVGFVATAPLALADAKGLASSQGSDSRRPRRLRRAPGDLPHARGRRVDSERYPGFGRLAREGTWYSRTTTVDEFTTRAVPAILTGNVPGSDALPTLADHPDNLFTLLGESYSFRVGEPVTGCAR